MVGAIEDPASACEAMEGADAIVNFAAESHVDRSIAGQDAFVRTHVIGTGVLLDAARELGVGRYLQVSTDEVYGSIEDGSFTETSPLDPSSPYRPPRPPATCSSPPTPTPTASRPSSAAARTTTAHASTPRS